MKTGKVNARTVSFIGMLGALSAVLMMISIPLPFTPAFLRFDISELPALFAGFFLGPASGCLVVVVKILLKTVIQGTDTAMVGEIMNIVGSCSFVLPASLIYRKYHTKKGAAAALVFSSVFVSVVFIFINAYIAFPMYSSLYGMPMDVIIGMGSSVNPLINDEITLMLYSVFPFNLIKHGTTSLCTWLVYKKCGNALRAKLELPALSVKEA